MAFSFAASSAGAPRTTQQPATTTATTDATAATTTGRLLFRQPFINTHLRPVLPQDGVDGPARAQGDVRLGILAQPDQQRTADAFQRLWRRSDG